MAQGPWFHSSYWIDKATLNTPCLDPADIAVFLPITHDRSDIRATLRCSLAVKLQGAGSVLRPTQRNPQGSDCSDNAAVPVTGLATARIRRWKVLGGLIHEYEQAA
jgi:hypothetical protein